MKFSTVALGAVSTMILLSIFITSFMGLITTYNIKHNDNTQQKYFNISNSSDNLIWFLQISDIHISIFRDPSRITEFKEFCDYTIDIIKPTVVLASGDLTDAKTNNAAGSQQYESEWRHYRDILRDHAIINKTLWLDIRGNHDDFNVISINSKYNYFKNYSMQGRRHPRSYLVQTRKGDVTYSFLALDATPQPGPRTPFNFVGVLSEHEVNEINHLINKVEDTGSNYTVWFGHFPTSCVASSSSESVRNLIKKDRNGFVYVCGHLHTMYGVVPRMYTMQKEGFLELEVGDWKDNRIYRIMAIDHGMFSFIDVRHREWPVMLVTNPKHALFINPDKENIQNIKYSTHIRVLAFSLSHIEMVRIRINNEFWTDLEHVKGPLYVTRWDPQKYLNGLHTIEVYVKDNDGREKTEQVPFSLDGSTLSFGILPRIVLMLDISYIFFWMFIFTLFMYLLPLFIFRYLHKLILARYVTQPKLTGNFFKAWLRKLWILTTIDRIFWPLVIYPIYLVFGPWSIGYVSEDYIGVVFPWGVYVNGTFLPGMFIYAFGFIQLLTFQIPLSFILANTINYRFDELYVKKSKNTCFYKYNVWNHFFFCLVFGFQLRMAYMFWLSYGTLASLLGPLRIWSLVLAVILYYTVLKLPEQCFRKAKPICFTKLGTNNDRNAPAERSSEDIAKTN